VYANEKRSKKKEFTRRSSWKKSSTTASKRTSRVINTEMTKV
jgi:hypothetical protein